MKVKEAVRRLNGYLQRRGKVDGSGGWTEQYLLDLLTDANLDMYHRVVNYGPEIFQLTGRFTYEANQVEVDLNSKLSGLPIAIWYAGLLPKDEDLSANNMPVQLNMPRRTNLDTTANGGPTSTTGLAEAVGSFSFGAGGSSIQAFFLGRDLSIRPIPRSDVYVYMRWTPDELPSLLDEDQDLLGGFLPQFHPAIVYKAAIQAKSAKGEDVQQLLGLYQEIIGQYDSNLKMGCKQRQRQQPQQRDPMRWEY
jgi:hypothetical protein|tara:strand:- start:1527 stop:2276 length:750 start_codon:yes stop_codon:yes gene_type:complete